MGGQKRERPCKNKPMACLVSNVSLISINCRLCVDKKRHIVILTIFSTLGAPALNPFADLDPTVGHTLPDQISS